MNKTNFFNGECGEVIEVSASEVNCQDEYKHTSVLLDIDGTIVGLDGDYSIILSPSEAKALASRLVEVAEKANNENYLRLRNKLYAKIGEL